MKKLDAEQKRFMKNFAIHCMTKLLSIKRPDSLYPEISGQDLSRIYKVVKEFDDVKN